MPSWDPLLGLVIHAERLTEPSSSEWTPPVDVLETSEAYVVTVELPGLEDDDIAIAISESRVTLSGRRATPTGTDIRYLRLERGHGRFSRALSFPTAIDGARIRTESLDGVLTLTLPKADAPGSRVEITEGDTSR